ncbi:CoaE-domain-containing protein [Aspergillus heteromorphus CBS 117.55]|uniref:CoaE-domain-containing protein n=1 Tax=Aspergillus heteromorphus CBS 117.55 TaxID=1448321 RepID=A0A317X106_9EURO|nr:CoaE-domain-containing protein [Aspergillus heteromorphus CBS 117.55]PWY92233.1 CoaE-domain-containing protein [Aspergillus heteromorphus CBS 117.55]
MLIIGLTGSIATGKSTVSALLSSPPYSLPIIDTDLLARKVVEPGTPGYASILSHFLPSTPDLLLPPLDANDPSSPRPLNRPALGRRVFGTSPSAIAARTTLNQIVHPAVRREIYKALLHYYVRGHWAVVLDVPLLFESGMDVLCGTVVVVGVRDPEVQMRRLRARDAHLSFNHSVLPTTQPTADKMFLCCDDRDYWVERDERGPRVCRKSSDSRRSSLPPNIHHRGYDDGYRRTRQPSREHHRQARRPAHDYIYHPPLRRETYEEVIRPVHRPVYPPVHLPPRPRVRAEYSVPDGSEYGHWVAESELIDLGKKAWAEKHGRELRKSSEWPVERRGSQREQYGPREPDSVRYKDREVREQRDVRQAPRFVERDVMERVLVPKGNAVNVKPRDTTWYGVYNPEYPRPILKTSAPVQRPREVPEHVRADASFW